MDPRVERLVEMLEALAVEGAPRLWELPPKVARGVADSMLTSMFNDGGPRMAQSDSELFAAALQGAGVPAELHVYDGAPHAFARMFMLDIAADAVDRIAVFARAARLSEGGNP